MSRVRWTTFQGEQREGTVIGVLPGGVAHQITDHGRPRCLGCSRFDRVLVCVERGGKGCEFYAPVAHFVNIPALQVEAA